VAIDYCVHFKCPPKHHLGQGNPLAGTAKILEMLKARNRAEMLSARAGARDKDPQSIKTEIVETATGGAPRPPKVRLADLQHQAAPLSQWVAYCEPCPVNTLGKAPGCFGAINYPISLQSEEWLMSHISPKESLGTFMLTGTIREYNYTGKSIAALRSDGRIFESTHPVAKSVEEKSLGLMQITSNQIWEALFGGDLLDPATCFMFLISFRMLTLDGDPLTSLNEGPQASALMRFPPAEKIRRTAVRFVSPIEGGSKQLANFMRAMHAAWIASAPVLISR
jgi:hypothetical protein